MTKKETIAISKKNWSSEPVKTSLQPVQFNSPLSLQPVCRLFLFAIFFGSWHTVLGQSDWLTEAESYLYTDPEKTQNITDTQWPRLWQENQWEATLTALLYANETNYYHGRLGALKSGLSRQDSLMQLMGAGLDSVPDQLYYKVFGEFHRLGYYHRLGQHEKSRKVATHLLALLKDQPQETLATDYAEFITATYATLAVGFQDEFRYNKAETHLKEALRLHTQFNHDQGTLLNTQNLLAQLYARQQKWSASNRLLTQALDYYEAVGIDQFKNSFTSCAILLTENLYKQKQTALALMHLERWKPYIKSDYKYFGALQLQHAQILLESDAYDQALTLTEPLLQLENGNSQPWKLKAQAHNLLGDYYGRKRRYKTAQEHYLNAYTIENANNPAGYKQPWNFETLNKRSQTYTKQNTETAWDSIIALGHEAVRKMEYLQKIHQADGDKAILAQQVLPLLAQSITACHQKYMKQTDRKWLESAFYFSEKSRSNILLDALQRNRATTYAGVPHDLLEKEALLKRQLTEQETPAESTSSFETKRELDSLITQLEKSYPAYHKLKYDRNTQSLMQLQQKLRPGESVLYFMVTQNSVYGMGITLDEVSWQALGADGSEDPALSEFIGLLSDPNSDLEQIRILGNRIYQSYVAPVLPEESQRIIIIPDGRLQNLPFESLYHSEKEQYLLEKAPISYTHSATLFDQLQNNTAQTNAKTLVLAPSFTTADGFSPLAHNQREAETVTENFPGQVRAGNSASLTQFKLDASNYGIIHFATHAQVNDSVPDASFLALSPTEKTHRLFIQDLYNLRIPSQLVTLSACSTEQGKQIQGEGASSLARAFFYSGTQALVSTHWQINDRSTAQIMKGFYGALAQGMPKDEALFNARTQFLSTHKFDGYAHPYFWAPFVLKGNRQPIKNEGLPDYFWKYALAGLALGTLGMLYSKRFRNSSASSTL
ncbi:CHAT domain-containing protein [Sediminicola luteus]|nr:CHAT domain-containing tetratricopeptide repeat protein [Sediminicola luteus]